MGTMLVTGRDWLDRQFLGYHVRYVVVVIVQVQLASYERTPIYIASSELIKLQYIVIYVGQSLQ